MFRNMSAPLAMLIESDAPITILTELWHGQWSWEIFNRHYSCKNDNQVYVTKLALMLNASNIAKDDKPAKKW